jgi:hypothetical protein
MLDHAERGAWLFSGPNRTIVVGEVIVGHPLAGEVRFGTPPDNAIGMIHTHQPTPGVYGLTFPGGPPSGQDAALIATYNIHGVVEAADKRYFQPWEWDGRYYTVDRVPPIDP